MADISLCIARKKLKIALKSDKLKLCQPFEIISDLVWFSSYVTSYANEVKCKLWRKRRFQMKLS